MQFLKIIFTVIFFSLITRICFGQNDAPPHKYVTGNTQIKYVKPFPVYTNGKYGKVYPGVEEVNGERVRQWFDKMVKPAVFRKNGSFEDYIFSYLKPATDKLENGAYSILFHNLIVDKTGRLVFFQCDTIETTSLNYTEGEAILSDVEEGNIMPSVQSHIAALGQELVKDHQEVKIPLPTVAPLLASNIYNRTLLALQQCPLFRPAMENNACVPSSYYTGAHFSKIIIVVSNHQSVILKDLKKYSAKKK